MPVVAAVRVWPTCAVPLIVGAPVAGSFIAVTFTVITYDDALSSLPSCTRKVKLA